MNRTGESTSKNDICAAKDGADSMGSRPLWSLVEISAPTLRVPTQKDFQRPHLPIIFF